MGEVIDIMEKLRRRAMLHFRTAIRKCVKDCLWVNGDVLHQRDCEMRAWVLACRRLQCERGALIEIATEEWSNREPSKLS